MGMLLKETLELHYACVIHNLLRIRMNLHDVVKSSSFQMDLRPEEQKHDRVASLGSRHGGRSLPCCVLVNHCGVGRRTVLLQQSAVCTPLFLTLPCFLTRFNKIAT